MMYIAICDDQAEELDAVRNLLQVWQEEHHTSFKIKEFSNAVELLASAEGNRFNLYFLDVMMPGMDGLAAAREIRRFDDTANIVFLTSSPGFAYESYRVRAYDYLLKPVQAQTLFPVLDRLFRESQDTQDGFSIKAGSTLIRILYSQLAYVEVNGKHLYFNLSDGTTYKLFGNLNEYEPLLLSRPEFMHIHRSYIVNLLAAAELSPSGLRTFSGKDLPISRKLFPDVQKKYMSLYFSEQE